MLDIFAGPILESGYRLQIPKMFAALALISAIGIALFLLLGLVGHLTLRRWHETAGAGEGSSFARPTLIHRRMPPRGSPSE